MTTRERVLQVIGKHGPMFAFQFRDLLNMEREACNSRLISLYDAGVLKRYKRKVPAELMKRGMVREQWVYDIASATPKPVRNKSPLKTTGDCILELIGQHGPLFAVELAKHLGIGTSPVLDATDRLMKRPNAILARRKATLPKHLAVGQRRAQQWQFFRIDIDGPVVEKIPQMPTIKPLRHALQGRPIIRRPGSDWALQSQQIVTLNAPAAPAL